MDVSMLLVPTKIRPEGEAENVGYVHLDDPKKHPVIKPKAKADPALVALVEDAVDHWTHLTHSLAEAQRKNSELGVDLGQKAIGRLVVHSPIKKGWAKAKMAMRLH